MNQPISKSSLSEPETWLVELCQKINFGRIEHLNVRNGRPVREPAPDVIYARKMGSTQAERPEASLQDFWLKQPVVDLIETIRNMGDGEILCITVQHGLPHLVEMSHGVTL